MILVNDDVLFVSAVDRVGTKHAAGTVAVTSAPPHVVTTPSMSRQSTPNIHLFAEAE